jgi:Uma2 family endonuclease
MPLASEKALVVNPASQPPAVLPLQNGDSLASREFLRRYERMPELKKAELIEGIVYMGSPVTRGHAKPDGLVQLWLGTYAARTPGVEFLPNATVILDSENTVQPDALLRLLPQCGGRMNENKDGLMCGSPDLIVEVAASTASIDLHRKFRTYQRTGVSEYLVWLVSSSELKWFVLEEERYSERLPGPDGRIGSGRLSGLVLDVKAMLALEAVGVLQALEEGLRSPQHASIVQRMKAALGLQKP